jgi:hypothetical protein
MGTRALEALKPVLVALKLPFAGEVTIPLTFVPIVDGIFPGNDVLVASAQALMKELGVLTPVYQELRRS